MPATSTPSLILSSSTATKLILYSDSYGGQNRNVNMVCLWLHIVASPEFNIMQIDHKFMVSGHSYLPNDIGTLVA